ncbi:MAG: hypothetical protein IT184_16130 [Acidobacteria bacterium]|nr:hypothetical protein [Acidobacteriota bacterium]
MKRLLAVLILTMLSTPVLRAENATRAGRFVVEPPTLICLGFEWDIEGDDNRNATVEVAYRAAGAAAWKEAMPLLRMGGEKIFRAPYTVPPRFAGSIIDLEPDTEYEVRLTMKDPDGISGDAVQVTKVRTRGEPRAAAGGRVLHVYPQGWKGPKQEPAYTGLMAAYAGAGTGDWNVVYQKKVEPGDVILMHAGLYKGDRHNYVDPFSTTFDGTYLLTAKGTPEKPIVIKAAGDGEVIIDGDGAFRLFDVMGSAYNIFDGLTIRNAEVAFWAGVKDVAGAEGLTVRNCRIENVGIGVNTQFAGSKNFYIADNIFLGRDDRHRVLGWANPGAYGAHPINSYYAVKVYGQGHVIAHNAVAFFHDGISVCTHGQPDAARSDWAVAIDIYNNDIHVTGDDFIEADGGVHNIRVLRNRGVNAAHTGLSAQPIFGGPAYYIRNVVYNTPVALKFNNPAGVYVLQNTIIAEHRTNQQVSNARFLNNLFLGTDAPRVGIASIGGPTAYSLYDHNGYRPNRGVDTQYAWLGPRPGLTVDYERPAAQAPRFRTLAELARASGQETHSIELDYDVFENLAPPVPPDSSKPGTPYEAVNLNFGLKPASKAVDAGVRIPNVNDGFSGKAPDLGAYEVGQPAPVYGPRTLTSQPFYR